MTCFPSNLLSVPMQAKQNGGARWHSGWTMYTYAYLAIVAVANIDLMASKESAL